MKNRKAKKLKVKEGAYHCREPYNSSIKVPSRRHLPWPHVRVVQITPATTLAPVLPADVKRSPLELAEGKLPSHPS
jgi:hypothetical protein